MGKFKVAMADLEKIQELVSIAVKKETDSLRGEIEKLKKENADLKKQVQELGSCHR